MWLRPPDRLRGDGSLIHLHRPRRGAYCPNRQFDGAATSVSPELRHTDAAALMVDKSYGNLAAFSMQAQTDVVSGGRSIYGPAILFGVGSQIERGLVRSHTIILSPRPVLELFLCWAAREERPTDRARSEALYLTP